MRKVIVLPVVAAMVAVLGAPAGAGPPGPEQLRKKMLTAGDLPPGSIVSQDTTSTKDFDYYIPCTEGEVLDEYRPVPTVVRTLETGHMVIRVELGGPGRQAAQEFVQSLADMPTVCPDWSDAMMEDEHHHSRLPLPALGDASAAMVTIVDGGITDEGERIPPERVLMAAVAVGDLAAHFEMGASDKADDARFVEFVIAGAKRLAQAG
ncbi:hypothetical protein AB0G04_43995 [Actinoplanes sp. NPDC023801]|uniref:hypothetical protein n=1 Tax=Actinoplanes sp. NPDC023801 TaxID=3154595 RepID=UPI0033EE9C09